MILYQILIQIKKNLCFICKKPKNNHLNYMPNDLIIDNELNINNVY